MKVLTRLLGASKRELGQVPNKVMCASLSLKSELGVTKKVMDASRRELGATRAGNPGCQTL